MLICGGYISNMHQKKLCSGSFTLSNISQGNKGGVKLTLKQFHSNDKEHMPNNRMLVKHIK